MNTAKIVIGEGIYGRNGKTMIPSHTAVEQPQIQHLGKLGAPTVKTSFRDKLISSPQATNNQEKIEIRDRDIKSNMENGIPRINFFDQVHNLLEQTMKLKVINRLLGKLIGYKTLWAKLHRL